MPGATEWIEILKTPEFALGLAAGVFLALLAAVLFRLSRQRQPETVAAFRNDAGQVLVSRRALQEQIQALCEETREVVRAQVKAKGRDHTLSIAIALKLRGDAHLTGISNEIQEHTRSFLKENLGIENVGSIDIVVSGILPAPSAGKASTLNPGESRTGE